MDRKYWFNNKSGSFVINTPNTGKYWYNHLWNEDGYYASVTQTGHGTIRYISEDCKNVILNKNEHRYFYLRDEESKDFWNISIMPSMIPINDYRCEHGLEFTRISAEYKGIKSSWFITVPEKGTYEVWKITMNNTTSQRRVLSAFSSIHFDLSGFEQPYNYKPQTTSETIFLDKVNAVFNWSKSPYQPHERCSGFIASSETVVNYDGWLDKFHGVPGNESRPDILINGKNCTNSNVTVRERCGILQNIIELLPGETKIIYYIVGFGCSPETAAKEINDAFNIAEHICKIAIERGLKRYGNLRVTTPDLSLIHI